VGLPGAKEGVNTKDPAIAGLLNKDGDAIGQFCKKFGPRGTMHSYAGGKITDTGRRLKSAGNHRR